MVDFAITKMPVSESEAFHIESKSKKFKPFLEAKLKEETLKDITEMSEKWYLKNADEDKDRNNTAVKGEQKRDEEDIMDKQESEDKDEHKLKQDIKNKKQDKSTPQEEKELTKFQQPLNMNAHLHKHFVLP